MMVQVVNVHGTEILLHLGELPVDESEEQLESLSPNQP